MRLDEILKKPNEYRVSQKKGIEETVMNYQIRITRVPMGTLRITVGLL